MQINSSGISDLANTTFSTTIVESRIGTKYIDWQGDGSILLNNRVKLSGSGITANNGYYYITDQWRIYDTVVEYETSGSFTVPAGVTSVGVVLFGGGGGGGSTRRDYYERGEEQNIYYNYYNGGQGGLGGFGFEKLSVSPSDTITFTIGAGGTGGDAYNGAGSTGGSSTLTYGTLSMTVTGGRGGYLGDDGANGTYNGYSSDLFSIQTIENVYENQIYITANDPLSTKDNYRSATTRNPIAYSSSGTYIMGAGGFYGYGSSSSTRNGDGGVGGGVLFFYKAP